MLHVFCTRTLFDPQTQTLDVTLDLRSEVHLVAGLEGFQTEPWGLSPSAGQRT